MSDLSKRMFDLAAERDERFVDTATDELVLLRIRHQVEANTISAELAYRDLEAVRAAVSS